MSLRVQATHCDPGGPTGFHFQREMPVNIGTQTQKWESEKERERSGKDRQRETVGKSDFTSFFVYFLTENKCHLSKTKRCQAKKVAAIEAKTASNSQDRHKSPNEK